MTPKRIGLTGNIGSGKSSVAKLLVEKGAALIDADKIATEVTCDPAVLEQIGTQLGQDLISDGQLDRAKTATLVFNNPEARKILNAIVHPLVRQKSEAQMRVLTLSDSPPPIILQDIPLLYENNLQDQFDAVVVVYAPLATRLARVQERNNMSEEEFYARDKAQLPLEEKVKRADYVVDNSGDLEALQEQVNLLWSKLVEGIGQPQSR
jgi:dephospho-CoA kinase